MKNFEDDEFYLDDNELAQENSLSQVGLAKTQVLNCLEKAVKELKDNIKFNEKQEQEANLQLISNYTSALISLVEVENDPSTSDEEVAEYIKQILSQTTELSFSNMNEVLSNHPGVETEESGTTNIDNDAADDSALDF